MDTRLVLLIVLFAALLAGCRTVPAGRIRAGNTGVEQSGPAAVPATAGRDETRVETVVPPGVTVTAHPDGSVSWVTAAPLSVVTTRTAEHATGPAAFAPPAPPSPAAQADGRARWLGWIGIIGGTAAGLFGLFRGWPVLGIGGGCLAAAGAVSLAVAALPVWFLGLVLVGAVCTVGGPSLWHFWLKHRDSSIAAQPRKVTV